MPRRHYDLPSLTTPRDFEAAARHLSFKGAALWLSPWLIRFWRAFPELNVNQIVRDRPPRQATDLDQLIHYGPQDSRRFEQIELHRDELVPVASAALAEAPAGCELQLLAPERLIHLDSEDGSWNGWEDCFDDQHANRLVFQVGPRGYRDRRRGRVHRRRRHGRLPRNARKSRTPMQITQVRNATLVIEYAGKRFLVDPMLSEKAAFPPFAGTPTDERNPLVDLPLGIDAIADVDAVIVTHRHLDHWDEAAAAALPKDLPLFAQHEKDAAQFRGEGFADVRPLSESSGFDGIDLVKTPGQHGSDEAIRRIGDRLGEVCGVVFRHAGEKTLYLAGDTLWNRHVEDSLAHHSPEVVVLNCGDARIISVGAIIMGTADVLEVSRAAPTAEMVATHMEAVNHAMLSRRGLREFAAAHGLGPRMHVPEDGETVTF